MDFSNDIEYVPDEFKTLIRWFNKRDVLIDYFIIENNKKLRFTRKNYDIFFLYGNSQTFFAYSYLFPIDKTYAFNFKRNCLSSLNNLQLDSKSKLVSNNQNFAVDFYRTKKVSNYSQEEIGLVCYMFYCSLLWNNKTILNQLEKLSKPYWGLLTKNHFFKHASYNGVDFIQLQQTFYAIAKKHQNPSIINLVHRKAKVWNDFILVFSCFIHSILKNENINKLVQKFHLSEEFIKHTLKFWEKQMDLSCMKTIKLFSKNNFEQNLMNTLLKGEK